MSLSVDGFWKAGFWAQTFWADGFWREGDPQPPTPDAPPTETPAGRRTRRRIVLRINGRAQEVESLEQVLDVLKDIKRELPATAREAAADYVRTGKRIGEAKREQAAAIEVESAPYSVRDMLQTRIDELQREFWRRVEAHMRLLDEEDEELMLL